MLCVLPEDSSDDVALHIHFTLIEAFCWENDIAVIKVTNYLCSSFREYKSYTVSESCRNYWCTLNFVVVFSHYGNYSIVDLVN